MLIQIISSVFVFYALYRTWQKKQKGDIKTSEFFAWSLFWLGVGVAFLIPASITRIANLLGIGRGADLVLYSAVLIVFYLLFRVFVRLDRMESQITKVVRHKSIEDGKKDIKK